MLETTIKVFVEEAFGIDPFSLKENSFKDVSKNGIQVLSYNLKTSNIEFATVLKIIRKQDSVIYDINVAEEIIEVSKEHRFYVKLGMGKQPAFLEVKDLYKIQFDNPIYLFNVNQEWVLLKEIEKTKNKQPIFDFEIEGNRNLYTNNYLSHNSYGDPNVATGGLGYKFYSDMRFKVSKQLQKDDSRNFTSVEVIKNKCGTPFGKAQFNINWGTGISYKEEVLDLASEKGIIKKSGSWYSYGEMKLGQGSAQVLELFNSNPEFFKEVEELVKKEYNVK